MAALSRRDIEMIFRAETDKATRPIADLGKAVKASRAELADLVTAAERGEVSLDKLGATTRDLKKAQDELGSARSLLTQLNAQEAALAKAEERVEQTGAKYRDLAERVAGAEKPTKTLTNQMGAAERAFNAAQEKLGQVSTQAKETREQIEGIIGPVANTAQSFRQIAETSRDIARGLAVAGTAADDFSAKMAAARAGASNKDIFETQAAKSPLMQEQINYISQFEDRVQRLRTEEAALASTQAEAASADLLHKAQQRAALDDVLQGNRALEAEIAAVATESQRVQSVNAYRQIAADANAAVQDVTRFGVSEDETAASTQRFAASIQALLNPVAAARSTLSGLESSVTAAAGVLDGSGTKSMHEYALAVNELQAAGAVANRVARDIDGYRVQEQAVNTATTAFRAAQAEALKLAGDLATVEEPTAEMARALKTAEAAVTTTGNAMAQEQGKLQTLAQGLKLAEVDVNELAAAETRLTAVARETAAAQAGIAQKTGGKSNLFGLRPDELQNLGYQVNDIFTQLASGTSIFRTLAQQGPQIFQIGGVRAFLAALGPLIPILLAVGAAVGVVAAAISRMNDIATETRQATAYLEMLGDKGSLTAKQISDASIAMQDLGVKAQDARDVIGKFNEGELSPEYLNAFISAAHNAADVTGKDFKESFGLLTDAMTGGYAEVEKLNDAFPVLTDAERVHIKAMFDSGQESEARRIVFDKFYEHMDAAAGKMGGQWSNAVHNLGNAWRDFLGFVGNLGPIQRATQHISELAIGVNYLLLRLHGLDAQAAGNAAVNGAGRAPSAPRPRGGRGPDAGRRDADATSAEGQQAIADANRELDVRKRLTKEERLRNAEIAARRAAPKQATDAERAELGALARRKEQNAINDEDAKKAAAAGRKAKSASDKAAREAQALANKINGEQETLEGNLDAMGAKVAKVSAGTLQDQLHNAAVAVDKEYERIYTRLADFSKLTKGRGTIGADHKTIDEYRAQLDANKEILTQQAQLKVYEDNVNDALNQRKALLADIEDKANRGQISGAEAIKETQEVTSKYDPIIQRLTEAAIQFAKSIGGATPSQELQAFIAKMQNLGSANSGEDQSAVRKAATANIGREENKLNEILAQRNSLVQSYQALQEAGVLSMSDARKKEREAYQESADAIKAQSANVTAAAQAAADSNAISGQALEAYQAKMQAVNAEATYLDPRVQQLRKSLDSMITQNAMQAIDKIAQSFGNAIGGTESWGDALKDAGLALLDFIAKTLIMVGELIIQSLILSAVDKATGGILSGLLAFYKVMGGGPTGTSGGGGPSVMHEGGTVGAYGKGRRTTNRVAFNPAMLASAPRYHSGTASVGLKPNEQMAVLEKGERVQTEEQQRLADKAVGARGSAGRPIRNVLAIGDDQVAAAMAGPHGEDVVLTHLRRNAPAVKQLVNG